MDWKELLEDAYNRVPWLIENVLNELTPEDIDWQPSPDTNPIGWLVWHLTRQQDAQIASLIGEEQLWIRDGWHERFGREQEPRDVGFGFEPEQVAAFKSPDNKILLGYLKASVARTLGYLKGLTQEDLDRELDEPQYSPLPTLGVRIISILDDCILHAGQAAYVRGLRQGKGWQSY